MYLTDQTLQMWSHWRDKCGPVDALSGYYPNLLANDPLLKAAYEQVIVGVAAIQYRMAELVDKEY
jgi:hypothetical protein